MVHGIISSRIVTQPLPRTIDIVSHTNVSIVITCERGLIGPPTRWIMTLHGHILDHQTLVNIRGVFLKELDLIGCLPPEPFKVSRRFQMVRTDIDVLGVHNPEIRLPLYIALLGVKLIPGARASVLIHVSANRSVIVRSGGHNCPASPEYLVHRVRERPDIVDPLLRVGIGVKSQHCVF